MSRNAEHFLFAGNRSGAVELISCISLHAKSTYTGQLSGEVTDARTTAQRYV